MEQAKPSYPRKCQKLAQKKRLEKQQLFFKSLY